MLTETVPRYLTPEEIEAAGLWPGFKNVLPLPKNPREMSEAELRAHFPGVDSFRREMAKLAAEERQARYEAGA
jgi:hypothetical protein